MKLKHPLPAAAIALALAVASLGAQQDAGRAPEEKEAFRFKSGVELINVTATVTDRAGRFYGRLRKEDFLVYEDNKPVEVSHFSADRTPVSLGIVVDTSGAGQWQRRDSLDDGNRVPMWPIWIFD